MDAYKRPDLSTTPFERVAQVHRQMQFSRPIHGVADSRQTYSPYDSLPIRYTNILAVNGPTVSSPVGSTLWSFTCAPPLCNMSGSLHGGCAATLLDSLTSTVLLALAKPGFLDGSHVSRTLTFTYLRPVPMGAECIIECWSVAAGKRTANVKGEIRLKDGKVAVTCVHDKVVFEREEKSSGSTKL